MSVGLGQVLVRDVEAQNKLKISSDLSKFRKHCHYQSGAHITPVNIERYWFVQRVDNRF